MGIDTRNRLVTVSTISGDYAIIGYRYYWYDIFTGRMVQSAEWRAPDRRYYASYYRIILDRAGNLYHISAFESGSPPYYSVLLSISADGQIRWEQILQRDGRVFLTAHHVSADNSLMIVEYAHEVMEFWLRRLSAESGEPIGAPWRIYQAVGLPPYEARWITDRYDYFAVVASDAHSFYLVVPEGHIDIGHADSRWIMDRQMLVRVSLAGELRAQFEIPQSSIQSLVIRLEPVGNDLWLFEEPEPYRNTGKIYSYRVRAVRADGDGNGDGCVDDSDLLGVLFALGSQNRTWDFNSDGVVDDGDLLRVLTHFGLGCSL